MNKGITNECIGISNAIVKLQPEQIIHLLMKIENHMKICSVVFEFIANKQTDRCGGGFLSYISFQFFNQQIQCPLIIFNIYFFRMCLHFKSRSSILLNLKTFKL